MASNLRVDSIVPATGSSVSIGTATGGVNIPGVLTYEDVTNVDSIGIITARGGIRIGGGTTVGPSSGIVTYFGDGSQLTGISAGVSLSNGADNRVITATSASAITGESNLTFDGTNLTAATGNVVIGTAAKGIDFSAQTASSASGVTVTSEIADHYEEGTWTPTLENAGSTTYSTQNGKYTRIGNVVYVTATIIINSHDGSSNSVTGFQNLPYPNNSNGQTVVFHIAGNEHWDTDLRTNNLTGWLTNGSSTIRIYKNSGNNLNAISVNDIGDNGELYVTGHYFVS